MDLGAKATLTFGPSGSTVSFTAPASGTEALDWSESQDVREVPGGRGVLASETGTGRTYDFSFSTDSSPVHDPALRAMNGQRGTGVLRPQGEGSGLPQFTFEGVVTTTLTFDLESDAVTWQVAVAVDGAPTEATQT